MNRLITIKTNKNNEECVINLVDIVIKGKIAVTTKEYCKKDDVIAIKGSIQTEPINGENKIKSKQKMFSTVSIFLRNNFNLILI